MMELLLDAIPSVQLTPLQTYGPLGSAVLLLGGWKGIAMLMSMLSSRNGGRTKRYNPDLCKRLHDEIDEERRSTREDIQHIRERLDDIFVEVTRGRNV